VAGLDDARRLRALVRSLPGLAVLVFDQDLRGTMVTGGRPIDLFHPPERPNREAGAGWEAELSGAPGRAPVVVEAMRAALDGSVTDLELHDPEDPDELWLAWFAPVQDDDGTIVGGLMTARNITAQRRAEWALLERNFRLDGLHRMASMLLEGGGVDEALHLAVTLPMPLIRADTGAVVVPSDLPGKLFIRISAGERADRLRGVEVPITGSVIGGVFERCEPLIIPAVSADDEEHRPLTGMGFGSVLLLPLAAERRSVGVLGFARAVGAPPFTEQEMQLIESFADQAAIALQHERTIQERSRLALLEERERIARELHDGVIQMLYSTGLELQAIAQLATGSEVIRRAEAVIDRLDQSIVELRAYIFALRPALLTGNPLDQVLEQFVAEFERVSGVIAVLESDARVVRELEPVGADVLQVVREALANVRRHARAATCRVTLALGDDDWLLVEIDDDGRGLPAGWSNGAGQGLGNLRQRAERHGGRLEVESSPGEGTTVRFRIPRPTGAGGDARARGEERDDDAEEDRVVERPGERPGRGPATTASGSSR
jgi:signal transduction histidine kinase